MGLDLGDRTIGVAISDELGWTAQGIETIRRENDDADKARLRELIKEYQVEEIVLGLPKNMNGTIGPRGELCLEYAENLRETFGLPVQTWDERLTTMAAEKMLVAADVSRKKRKKVIDKMAAVMILQGFLDFRKK
jgi:putative holliday junction resolvase